MKVLGNLNVDLMDKDNLKFVEFMKKYLYLDLASSKATNLGGSCRDLIFARNVHINCKSYNSYTVDHRPILSLFEL